MTTEQFHVSNPGRRFLDTFVGSREVFETSPAFIYGTGGAPAAAVRDPIVFLATGYAVKARADTALYRPATAIYTGTPGVYQLSGVVDGYAGLVTGGIYYLGSAGGITAIAPLAPDLRQAIGIAKSATELILTWNAALDSVLSVSRARSIFFGADYGADYGSYRVRTLTTNFSFNYTFFAPFDYQSLIALDLIVIPLATFANKGIWLYSQYGTIGEAYNIHAESDLTKLYSGVIGQLTSIDLRSVFNSIMAGDYCGLNGQNQAIGTSLRALGIRMRYWST